ncbi:nuclear transport factor 2 family protein [Kitasatospora sp. NPDC048722]|uniref:nuclear transport factor 2 family protein n=1 Tax=Kitasatospora sp. NPDC048722 TaxID=3155639 RepID=UPI0033EA3B42
MPEATSAQHPSAQPFTAQPLTAQSVRAFAERWYAALDRHDDEAEVRRFLADDGLELHFPEGTFRGHAGFRSWYEAACRRFFDERHVLREVRVDIAGDRARVHVRVDWWARHWSPPAARSEWLGFRADQTWAVVPGANGEGPLIETYTCDRLEPMPGSAELPEPR